MRSRFEENLVCCRSVKRNNQIVVTETKVVRRRNKEQKWSKLDCLGEGKMRVRLYQLFSNLLGLDGVSCTAEIDTRDYISNKKNPKNLDFLWKKRKETIFKGKTRGRKTSI